MAAIAAGIAFTRPLGADYANPNCAAQLHCGDAAPGVRALADGDFGAFVREQRLIGPVSLYLRAPFAAAAPRDDPRLEYRLGAFACLLALGAAALLLAAEARIRGRPGWQQALAIAGVMANPLVFRALKLGHPEELAATAAVLAALVVGLRGRGLLAGLLIGLAICTKLWALAALPALVLLLAARDRRALATGLAAVALVAYAPLAIGDAGRFGDVVRSVEQLGTRPGTVTPANLWFPLARKASFRRVAQVRDGHPVFEQQEGYRLPGAVARIARASILLAALLLALWWRARASVLLLVALTLLLRCVMDPGNLSYYHLPFVVVLLAYEVVARGRFPWMAAAAMATLEAIVRLGPHVRTERGFAALYLGWAAAALAVLACHVRAITLRRPSQASATSLNRSASPSRDQ